MLLGKVLYGVRPFGLRAIHSTNRVLAASSSTSDASTPGAEVVRVKPPFSMVSIPLDPKYRAAYDPMYTSPSHKNISILKRLSLGIGMLGAYLSHIMADSSLISNDLSYVVAGLTTVPIPVIAFLTQHHVCRIFRLYDTTKPQTLENLTNDETLLVEKLSWTGRSTYFQTLKVLDTKLKNKRFGFINWVNGEDRYYIMDDIGGIKMDRIWGIVEHNSGINNGRYFEKR